MAGELSVGDLARKYFERIPIPEAAKRESGVEGYEFAAPFETKQASSRAFRVGRAWDTPPVVQFRDVEVPGGIIKHCVPDGVVMTENKGLPPMIAQYLQRLRNGGVDPFNRAHIAQFQKDMWGASGVFFPLVLGHVANVLGERSQPLCLRFKDSSEDYGRALATPAQAFTSIPTLSGGLSNAGIASLDDFVVEGSLPLNVGIVAVHRAGILPSLVLADLIRNLGGNADIIGVDAKRHNGGGSHFSPVQGAYLVAPGGYQDSTHSVRRGEFVLPSEKLAEYQAILIPDPMLAKFVSVQATAKGLREFVPASTPIFAISLFAGGYSGIKLAEDLGIHALVAAHDQCDLTDNGYIQPGLGDAGDKTVGYQADKTPVKDTFEILANFRDNMPGLESIASRYALQICGRELQTRAPEQESARRSFGIERIF